MVLALLYLLITHLPTPATCPRGPEFSAQHFWISGSRGQAAGSRKVELDCVLQIGYVEGSALCSEGWGNPKLSRLKTLSAR